MKPTEPRPGGGRRGRDPALVRRRAAWLVAAVTALGVTVLFVLPGRTWLEQRSALARTSHQLSQLSAENAKLSQTASSLNTDAEIEHIARERYGLVMPGEQEYVVLPPAPGVPAGEASTTTTTIPTSSGRG